MLKKAVRIGILAMLVASFMLSPLNTTPALAVSEEEPEWWWTYIDVYDVEWDGSTDWEAFYDKNWEFYLDWFYYEHPLDLTVGELKSELEAYFGFPMMAVAWIGDKNCDYYYPVVLSDGDLLADYPYCPDYWPGETWIMFVRAPEGQAATRLTLYGYIQGDGKTSCTLWSLDGSKNLRPSEKCGADVELVCTVKLVDMELKYECEEGYEWLGYKIAHDSKWVSWAHKFASMNGRK